MKMKPVSTIKLRLGINPNGPVQKFFTDRCRIRMDKYIPMDTGALRDTWTMGTNYITYEQPYAHAQYVGIVHGTPINPENYKTTGTGPYWDKRMVSAEMPFLVREVQEYINGNR